MTHCLFARLHVRRTYLHASVYFTHNPFVTLPIITFKFLSLAFVSPRHRHDDILGRKLLCTQPQIKMTTTATRGQGLPIPASVVRRRRSGWKESNGPKIVSFWE